MTKKQTTAPFGMHLMLDAYGADVDKLNDMKLVFKFLNDLPELIGMTKLSAPSVLDCDATKTGKDPGGISGFVIIAESHVSIHTFAKRAFFTMDLYSCNNFEDKINKVLEYTKKTFGFTKRELNIVTRGKEYPTKNVV